MALADRANNILPHLLSEERLKSGEIAFVAHSFGGLIVEQILRSANDRAGLEQEAADFVKRVTRVSFLGVPHVGADLATWGGRFRLVTRPSQAAQGLGRNDPHLRELNQWYRGYAQHSGILTQTLTETKATRFGLIVKADSADPGLPSLPTPVDEDHYSIASPASRTSQVYKLVRTFLSSPIPREARRTLIADDAINAISEGVDDNQAALARIEQKVSSNAVTLAGAMMPGYLVNNEAERRVQRLRKGRFFNGFNTFDDASRLARDLLGGDLALASADVKADALAWCARLLLARPDRKEANEILGSARSTALTHHVSITAALADSYEGKTTEAQHASIQASQGTTPVWTTLDLLMSTLYSPAEQREFRTNLRRCSFGFVPIRADELIEFVGQAQMANGRLIEGAELRAIRESLQVIRMSNGLQLPKEIAWLEGVAGAFSEAIRAQWDAGIDETLSVVRSDWLLAQFDIRQWSHRYRNDGNLGLADERFKAQVLSLCVFNKSGPPAVKVKYWKWLDEALLKRIQDEQRELYEGLVQQVRAIIVDSAGKAGRERADDK